MLKHVVFMKFKDDVTDDKIAALEKGLAGLPGVIAEIKGFYFGRDVIHSERSYDFALVGDFESLEAMQRYQVHPAHVAVVGIVRSLSSSILAVDFEF